jgi:hypothetical protein
MLLNPSELARPVHLVRAKWAGSKHNKIGLAQYEKIVGRVQASPPVCRARRRTEQKSDIKYFYYII